MTPTLTVLLIFALLGAVAGSCLTYWWTTRPTDQADALAALRRIHEQAIYAWDAGDDELDALVDTIDTEIAALDLYDDDYIEPA